jgi:Fe-S-cluster containining protein
MTLVSDLDCQACGACCSFSADWPRFSTESETALDLLPSRFVAEDERGMRCNGSRCSALSGRVGFETSCLVYEIRPEVCRECVPGDAACLMARDAFGMTRPRDIA